MAIELNAWGKTYELYTTVNKYSQNGSLAIGLVMDNGEPYSIITVNLGGELEEDCAFVDTNNMPDIEDILKKYHLAEPTGRQEQSGFCTYPEYKFNLNEVNKHSAENR